MNYRGGKEAFWATAAAESEYLSGVVDHGLGGGVAEPPEDSGADHQPTMRGASAEIGSLPISAATPWLPVDQKGAGTEASTNMKTIFF